MEYEIVTCFVWEHVLTGSAMMGNDQIACPLTPGIRPYGYARCRYCNAYVIL